MKKHLQAEYDNFKEISGILTNLRFDEVTEDILYTLLKSNLINGNQIATMTLNPDYFEVAAKLQITESLKRINHTNKSPYKTDKELGFELKDGLSSVFPVNTRCVTFAIQGKNSVGYIAVNPNGKMVEIFQSGGVIEEFNHGKIKQESILHITARDIEWQLPDIEREILNKPEQEYNEVFLMRTGYKSLKDFIEEKMPELVSQLTDKNEILENIHRDGLSSIAKFHISLNEEGLLNAAITSQIYKNLLTGEHYSENERIAFLDQMSYMDKYDDLITINNLNTINTELLCKLSAYGVDRFKTDNGSLAVFKLEDGTAIVSMDGSLSKYKPDELIEEFDGIYNTEELFEVLDMVYLGECSIEIDEHNGPAVKRKNKIKP